MGFSLFVGNDRPANLGSSIDATVQAPRPIPGNRSRYSGVFGSKRCAEGTVDPLGVSSYLKSNCPIGGIALRKRKTIN